MLKKLVPGEGIEKPKPVSFERGERKAGYQRQGRDANKPMNPSSMLVNTKC